MHKGFSGVPPVYTLWEPLRPGGFAKGSTLLATALTP